MKSLNADTSKASGGNDQGTMSADSVSLNDRYRIDAGRALISGCQALVRLPIAQRELDRRRGLNTAGYISGYRGSPLGGYDGALWKAADELARSGIIFHPGVNEDLALTAVAGTQQIDFLPGKKVDGVFALWYGKGPGVDRSGDAIKHANLQGVSPNGGVVLIYGDDHNGKSSTTAHQSDLTLASWGVPTLYPSSVAEILQLGLAAVAMSRHSGLLVGLKLVNETAEATEAMDLPPLPEFIFPPTPEVEGGVHIRPEIVATQRQDARLVRHKLPMAADFARANNLDRISFGHQQPEFLIATAGKAYPDVVRALDLLGIDDVAAQQLGVGVYKIALIYPLEPSGLKQAAAQAAEICFVEEKRPHAETQAMAILYPMENRPRITGKHGPDGRALLPADLPLDATTVALALADRLEASFPGIAERLPSFAGASAILRERLSGSQAGLPGAARRPAFCPGCPHNLSTKVPEGSFGATGIGCHAMALFHPERKPIPMGHMGAEGANWIGLSSFTDTPHIFQNLGDGTYNHSGSLAIRAAVQAGISITYKILFNDAVAMTGGQPVEGGLTVARIIEQVKAEGVERIVVLSEDPARFSEEPLPRGTELRHRDDLALVQEALREVPGVTVLVYDQVCAAEKRRRRKINAYPDPDRRTFINALVCEGCGDCSTASNCLAIQPLETELGRKRKIDQSACNKDFSCIAGFCPSFVTVEGGEPHRARRGISGQDVTLPDPVFRSRADDFDMIISGVGGTGVVTIAAVLAMAAQIDGLHANIFDMTGLSQKGGAVFSHLRIRANPSAVVSAKIGAAEADLVLACDLIAAVHPEVLSTISETTLVAANSDTSATASFQLDRDATVDPATLVASLAKASGAQPSALHASQLATRLFGDSITSNMILLGFAWQLGGVPLTRAAIVKSIELNNRSVAANLAAFKAGRAAALDADQAAEAPETIEGFVARRGEDLAHYWNASYARRYLDLMDAVRAACGSLTGSDDFAWAVARSAYKLMAYKDEYEVARLYTDGRFRAAIANEFEGIRTLKVHLSPPILARIDPRTGHPRKMGFGPWIFPMLSLLSALKPLRETAFDLFGRTAERKLERDLRDAYMDAVKGLCATLSPGSLDNATRLAASPLAVRGFGHVKLPAAAALLTELRASI